MFKRKCQTLRRNLGIGLEQLEDRNLLSAGILDPTFGTGGQVATSIPGLLSGTASAEALQPDGKIVTVGVVSPIDTGYEQFALTRTDPDGSLDPTFGNNGRVITQFSNVFGPASVVLQPDGKIIVAGSSAGRIALARFNADGSVDTSFGVDGIATSPPAEDTARAVALEPNGQIVVLGEETEQPSFNMLSTSFALVRFNSNGTVDTTFGTGGKVTAFVVTETISTFMSSFASPSAIAIQADGRIVVTGAVGTTTEGGTPTDPIGEFTTTSLAVARFNTDGSPDTTFATAGTEVVNALSAATALALQPDNKELITTNGNVLARLNPYGSLDTSFGQKGMVTTPSQVNGIALQSSNEIVVAGGTTSTTSTPSAFTLARYNANGALDATFGQNGTVTTGFGSMNADATLVFIGANQQIVASGTVSTTSNSDNPEVALARYNSNGILDSTFGTNGQITFDFPDAFSGTVPVTIDAMALQGDGKILVAGTLATPANLGNTATGITDLAVARYNSEGSLDTTFGQDGWATFSLTSFGGEATALAVDPDGKILVAGLAIVSPGSAEFPVMVEFVLARLNADGSLDHTFGNQGVVTGISGVQGQTVVTGVLIQPDGKIVEVGQAFLAASQVLFSTVAVRYNSNGSVDSSFGANGVASTTNTNDTTTSGTAVLQPDGKIVVVGGTGPVRFNADGSVDTTFGTAGTASFFGSGAALALQPDGKLVEVGQIGQEGSFDFAVARYNANGTLDTTFGNAGMVATAFSDPNDQATSVVIEPNGKILVGGAAQQGSTTVFALARYNANGSLDAGFGTGGELLTAFPSGTFGSGTQISAMVLQPDGSLLAAGSAQLRDPFSALSTADLARFLLPPSQNERFVDQMYRDLLGRQVDPFGLPIFLNELDEGVATRDNAAIVVEQSQEYRTDEVENLYMTLLHRTADPGGLQAWLSLLQSGQSIVQIKAGILGSQEYFQDHGGSNAMFLQRLYQDVLGRAIDPTGAAAWGAELANGTSRQMVASQILASTEAETDLITGIYQKYLHRAPDSTGLAFWLNGLQQGINRVEDVVAQFIGSEEYFSHV